MSRFRWVLISFAFMLTLAGGLYLFMGLVKSGLVDAPEVDWRQLGEMDYVTGAAPDALKKFDGQMVKIPGFMVPLEDNQRQVIEFLLVPTPQACIHVPPPPPNQMVHIKMKEGATEAAFGPIWVYGTLRMQPKKHMYGESSFQMEGVGIEPYK